MECRSEQVAALKEKKNNLNSMLQSDEKHQIVAFVEETVLAEPEASINQIKDFLIEELQADEKINPILSRLEALSSNISLLRKFLAQNKPERVKGLAERGAKIVTKIEKNTKLISKDYCACLKNEFQTIKVYYSNYLDTSQSLSNPTDECYIPPSSPFPSQSAGIVLGYMDANSVQESAYKTNQKTIAVIAEEGIASTKQMQGMQNRRDNQEIEITKETTQSYEKGELFFSSSLPFQHVSNTDGKKGAYVLQKTVHEAHQSAERTISSEGNAKVEQTQDFQQGQNLL